MNGHERLPLPPPPSSTPARTSAATSCCNRFLSSMTLIAIGAIGGFSIFHSALQHRIEQTEHTHNATLAFVNVKFVESEKERIRCIETDDGRLQEISDLRGRLDAQHKSWYDLSSAQRSMVSKQKESTAQIHRFQEVNERDQMALISLKAESDQKDRELVAIQEILVTAQEDLHAYQKLKIDLESELVKVRKEKEEETNSFKDQIQYKNNELENANRQLDLISDQKSRLVAETQDLRMSFRQKDEELAIVNKSSISVQNQKDQLDKDIADMKDKMVKLESEIVEKDKGLLEKDKGLFEYREGVEKERREFERRIQQQENEIESVTKNYNHLRNQNKRFEKHIAELDVKIGKLKSKLTENDKELSEKDKELFKYREEEGELETKLVNFREGMLELFNQKVHEVKTLENRVDSLKKEKADLELKLDNWREGMLSLVKEKLQEINQLKTVLAESRKSMKAMMQEIEMAQSEQIEAEEFVKERLDTIDRNTGPEQEEMMRELMQEIERVRADLKKSQDWVISATEEIEFRKKDQDESEKLITGKTNEIKELKLQIERDQESTKKEILKLENDLVKARTSVEEKTNQINYLNSELEHFVKEINELKSVLAGASINPNEIHRNETSESIITHVQHRDDVMCRLLFGKGPYYVKFVVRIPSIDSNNGDDNDEVKRNNTVFFVVELSSRKELPHSTYTFLTLVESNLYNDSGAYLSAGVGSSLEVSSSSSKDTISLEQKLKPLGLMGGSSLSFIEPSISGNSPICGDLSFGFTHRGPGLTLFLSGKDDNERTTTDNETSCFAQVIRGEDKLREIHSLLLENGEPLEIISAKYLRVD